jgi:hypothetical protein
VVYPDPIDFQHTNPYYDKCKNCGPIPSGKNWLKFGCVPVTSTLKIYTISLGGLVRAFPPGDPNYFFPNPSNVGFGTVIWDGNNGDGNPVAAGFYLYVVDGPTGRTFGKFAISRSGLGP